MKRQDHKSRPARSRESNARDGAEAIAVAALSFLADDAERLGAFLALSGIGPESIRAAASEPHFLAGVLEHVVSDERLLLDVAEHLGIDPFEITRARATLAGRGMDEP